MVCHPISIDLTSDFDHRLINRVTSGGRRTITIRGLSLNNSLNRRHQPRSHLRRRKRPETGNHRTRGSHLRRNSLLLPSRHHLVNLQKQRQPRQVTLWALRMLTTLGQQILNKRHLSRSHLEQKSQQKERRENHRESESRQLKTNQLGMPRLLATHRPRLQLKLQIHPHRMKRVTRRRNLRLIIILSASSQVVRNEYAGFIRYDQEHGTHIDSRTN